MKTIIALAIAAGITLAPAAASADELPTPVETVATPTVDNEPVAEPEPFHGTPGERHEVPSDGPREILEVEVTDESDEGWDVDETDLSDDSGSDEAEVEELESDTDEDFTDERAIAGVWVDEDN